MNTKENEMNTETSIGSTDLVGIPAIEPEKLPTVVSKVNLTDAEVKEIETIKRSNPIKNTASIITYASSSQKKLGSYLDELLKDETVGSSGIGGNLTVEISRGIESMQLEKMRSEIDGKNFLVNLPVIGKYFSAFQAFLINREKISKEFERIQRQGEKEITRLVDATTRFDGLIVQLELLLRQHVLHLIAGSEILDGENARYEVERSRLMALDVRDRDPAQVAQLMDYRQRIIQFEVRLVNLHKDYLDNVQSIPQIRNTSKASEMQMQNVMESLTSDLNRLKKAVLNMISLNDIKKAKKNSDVRRDTARKLARYSADATRDAYLESKEQQGKFDDELEHLTYVASVIKDTVQRGNDIDRKNAEARKQVNNKLVEMRNSFNADIQEVHSQIL